ncbi:hypothetical protein [Burkholderia lata]|uniref:hypothetical protein n=1 Tax=Burkholderia lata (strain ATCC 17760 / DSM 23089 / LMG 22485 / NCIMB 9086 / R18194 / 383) TaxID=482957 RepID=UPI0018D2F329|nr:hypothetical protein [Burkholderia lata]
MRPDVQNDRDRRLQVARKSRNEGAKCIDAARRRTDCDEVPMSQCASDIPATSRVDPHRPRILHFIENVFTARPVGPEELDAQFLYRTAQDVVSDRIPLTSTVRRACPSSSIYGHASPDLLSRRP